MKKGMFYVCSLALVGLLSACGGVTENKETTYKLESTSMLKWKGIYADDSHNHYGTVEVKNGSITFNGDEVKDANFVVDLSTIVSELSPEDGRDKLFAHLSSPKFLNAEAYPNASVKILSIKGKDVEMVISVNKKEVKVTVPMTVHKSDKELHLKGDFTVDFTPLDAPGFKADPEEEKIKPNQFVKPVVEFSLDLTLNAAKAK